ncbi:hypothetical protein [Falsigemmobacter faecalis]|uniref:Uncharacterized protein n=1 Tax=Falsigemmobacter faecalis TaxID=2488730 RepID=A0A3P3DCE4_9RHOB|nr:hypothetical protein [Falsigemmobacter faecalis]RRH72009.1 hypothetical protein EG244_15965 [Falsigemmobacter faecalis]
MEKVDWALLISILSFCAATASAFYTRRMAVQDAQRMKRKSPILEVLSSNPLRRMIGSPLRGGGYVDIEGYWETRVTIRNLEPTARLKINAIAARRGVLISDRPSLEDPDKPSYDRPLQFPLPSDAFRSKIRLGYSIEVFGTPHRQPSGGDAVYPLIYSKSKLAPSDLKLDWEWLDGQPK